MKLTALPPITDEQRAAEERALALSRQTRITCRVCGLRDKVGIDNAALLCGPCRIEPLQTRAHVLHLRDTYRARLWAAGEKWEETLGAAAPTERERWARVESAKARVAEGDVDREAFVRTWARARAAGDAFARLLLAREAYEHIAEECNAALDRAESGLRELAAYQDNPPPPGPARAGEGADK